MDEKKSILHELYVFSEWKPEPEYIQKPDSILPENISALWRWVNFLGPKKNLLDAVTAHLEKQQKWHIALGDEGKVIAVLTDNILEIRTKRSEYATIAARTTVSRDAYPQWRKLVWSPDCSLVVLAYGNGVVSFFDLTASNLFNIPTDCSRPGGLECTDNTHAVADIIFMPLRVKDTKWNWEVLVVTYDGRLRGFLVSQTDACKLHHSFRFPAGVAALRYCESHSTMYVAGVPRGPAKAFIVRMELSPDGTRLVCLHCNGDVSVWRLPLLKLECRWALATQPHHDLRNPLAGDEKPGNKKDLTAFYPADINWWSNEEIIVSRFSGAVTICDIETMANILGKKPEFFQGAPQITRAHGGTAMVLECEGHVLPARTARSDPAMEVVKIETDSEDTMLELAKELIKSVLYAITDIETFQPKPRRITVVSRVYRLLGLKSTTPTELFSRKIESGAYGEALALADRFQLDSDLVYQQQWRKNPVSSDAIHNYLSKVSKKIWAVHQCVDRLPESLPAAKELLQFGLQLTNDTILAEINAGRAGRAAALGAADVLPRHLNAYTAELLRCRHVMLFYQERLQLYEKQLNIRSIWSSNWSEDSSPDSETAVASAGDVAAWYERRARAIERRSGLVSHALALLRPAAAAGLPGLERVLFHLTTLDVLVYDVNVEGVSLDQLQNMSTLEVCSVLMKMSTPQTFVSDLKQFVVPYLKRCESLSKCNDSCVTGLIAYLESISVEDLSPILLVLQSPAEFELDVRTHLELVERCLFAHTGTDQLDKACDLLHTLLKESDGSISSSSLVRRVRCVERLVAGSERLSVRGVLVPPRELVRLRDEPQRAAQLLTKLARSLALREEKPTPQDWDKLLKDLLELQSTLFCRVAKDKCYEIYALALLTSGDAGSIKLARSVLTCSPLERAAQVPHPASVALVSAAATEYFNSANSLVDPALELAKEGQVLQLAAARAMAGGGAGGAAAVELARRLAALRFAPAAGLLSAVGRAAQAHADAATRRQLLAAALAHCPAADIEANLRDRMALELESLQQMGVTLREHSSLSERWPSTDDEFADAVTTPMVEKKDLVPAQSDVKIPLFNYLLDTFQNKFAISDNKPAASSGAEPSAAQCQEFYQSLYPELGVSPCYYRYDRFSLPDATDGPLAVGQNVLKWFYIQNCLEEELDYKLLVSGEAALAEHVVGVLRPDNVALLSKLLRTLPPALAAPLSLPAIYAKWLTRHFFSVPSNAPSKKWMQQYRQCASYFNKLAKHELVQFVEDTCFSDEAIQRGPACSEQSWAAGQEQSWAGVGQELARWARFLDILHSDTVQHLLRSAALPALHVWPEVEKSHGDPERLVDCLARGLLQAELRAGVLARLLQVLHVPARPDQLLQHAARHCRSASDSRSLHCEYVHHLLADKSDQTENLMLIKLLLQRPVLAEEEVNWLADNVAPESVINAIWVLLLSKSEHFKDNILNLALQHKIFLQNHEVDEDLLKELLDNGMFIKLVSCPLYSSFINYIMSKQAAGGEAAAYSAQWAAGELARAGLAAEAGQLRLAAAGLPAALRGFSQAVAAGMAESARAFAYCKDVLDD
ncbi:unnamed protein product [Spodoptera littoralis]|uniref:Neuroblastoma-amplified sequence n=1 Tax=Spodoptera littoralis TaxID=7109 RepID=A0A9P0N2N7_SPOLI|nr:unnamed protein product [Spodoptera littoralis]CAH1639382.1 unnamed protein product [Spodoptera littoralis]